MVVVRFVMRIFKTWVSNKVKIENDNLQKAKKKKIIKKNTNNDNGTFKK